MRLQKVCVLAFVFVLLLGGDLFARRNRAQAQDQQWAQKMFDKLEQDFGKVPSGAAMKQRIKITNNYQQTVHISGVRSTCGCTAGKPSKETLLSEEFTYLDLTMNTRNFQGLKETTLFVTFDQPIFAEVQIPVKAFIIPDLMINPGAAEFGAISKGTDRLLRLAVGYNGRGISSIKEAVCKNPNISAKLLEVRRDAFNINYELHVTVKGTAPLGDIRDQVILVTDDPNNRNIPVLVEARIEPEFAVTPDLVSFGTLAPGARKTMTVIIRSTNRQPFTIEKIESEKTVGTFETRLPKDARELHQLPLTFIAPKEAGSVTEEFTVTIGGTAETVTFKAIGKVDTGTAQLPGTGAPVAK
jgi:hypothetical protein